MADYIHDITRLLPQGPPFIMVDQLLYVDEHTARTSFRVRADNPLVDNGTFTAAGLMENIAQTAAAGAGYAAHSSNGEVRTGYIVSVSNLEIKALPIVDDELTTETTI